MKPLRSICILVAFLLERSGQSLNRARRRASLILAVSVVASVYLFWKCDTRAQSADDLPTALEPQLAEPGDWAADFNHTQLAYYEGHMRACDSIWKSHRVQFDTCLFNYVRTCGGRVGLLEIRVADLSCSEVFAR